jgi:hypothetical protein
MYPDNEEELSFLRSVTDTLESTHQSHNKTSHKSANLSL